MSNEIKIENLKFGYGYKSKKIFNGLNVSIGTGTNSWNSWKKW